MTSTPYATNQLNEAVTIRTSEAVELWASDSKVAEGTLSVEFQWLPYPRMLLRTELEESIPPMMEDDNLEIRPTSTGTAIRVLPIRWNTSPSDTNPTTAEFVLKDESVDIQSSNELSEVVFHLANFPQTVGFKAHNPLFKADDWEIKLDYDKSILAHQNKLKEDSGYAITYKGTIKRSDGNQFTIGDANNILECLHYFFSFACGRWTAPLLPIGFDSSGEKVWEQWGKQRIDPWKYVLSWFTTSGGAYLAGLFPGFYATWTDETMKEALRLATYWYLQANGKAGDTAIVVAQTAFETLSWKILVEGTFGLSSDGISKLPAADQLRLLLNRASIPKEIPDALTHLTKVLKEYNDIKDGCGAVTSVRNSIVHSLHLKGKKDKLYNVHVMNDAWLLSTWYLELLLLHFCDYNLKYENRLRKNRHTGDVENVPWKEPT